jgi:hypothetical protein
MRSQISFTHDRDKRLHFLMVQNVEPERAVTQIKAVLNWLEQLKQRASCEVAGGLEIPDHVGKQLANSDATEVTSESTRILYARRRRGRHVGAAGVRTTGRTTTDGRARKPGASPGLACAAQRTDSRTRTTDHRSASPFMAAPRMAIFAG